MIRFANTTESYFTYIINNFFLDVGNVFKVKMIVLYCVCLKLFRILKLRVFVVEWRHARKMNFFLHSLYRQVERSTHVENHAAIIYALVICHNCGPSLCNLTISLRSNGNAYQFFLFLSLATTVISLRIASRKIT